MYTCSQLLDDLRALGIRGDDTLMVHTALRSVNADAYEYIAALRQSCGLLLIPAHTWGVCREDGDLCDLNSTMPNIGTVPCTAVRLAAAGEGIRSQHPTHSVAAFGKDAEAYIANDALAETPAPWNGSFGKLYENGGKILLVGVDQGRNTFLHAVDEWLDIPDRLRPARTRLYLRDARGNVTERPIYRHLRSMSDNYMNYEPYFLQTGAVTMGRLGDAVVRVCDARGCAETVKRLWEKADRDLCATRETLDIQI